jgi:hypothetical protein
MYTDYIASSIAEMVLAAKAIVDLYFKGVMQCTTVRRSS